MRKFFAVFFSFMFIAGYIKDEAIRNYINYSIKRTFGITVPNFIKSEEDTVNYHTDLMPKSELSFIKIIHSYKERFSKAETDLVQASLRQERSEKICSIVNYSTPFKNWIGIVDEVSSTGYGYGILSIKISKDISVGTASSSSYDKLHEFTTLLLPKTNIYKYATTLRKGDVIKFSGLFIDNPQDCIYIEGLYSHYTAMNEPYFVLRFENIKKLTP